MKRSRMKRKRRDLCPSPLLDEGPKRTKVHAQRKFAQGSNVNSPVITPVKEFERPDRSSVDPTPEPVELLPIRRPNTEDFLTFLCFRGTPLLPPNLNFFNTASIVDTNGQVHEIKSESPKNGPIDTPVITKGGSGSSDRPFIAFGVRKRADPIVISKQMEKKRRHALALQALRRKYQEQKMAKIRAVTISKLSEKPSNRATVRSNSIPKIEKVHQAVSTKPTIQKNKVKVISSKHINVTTQAVRTVSSKMKPKMCLRSFRGRFVQQELPFRAVRKHKVPEKKLIVKKALKKVEEDKKNVERAAIIKKSTITVEKKVKKVVKQKETKVQNQDSATRITRSKKLPLKLKRKQIVKRRILIPSTSSLVKSRVLRSQTLKTSNVIPRLTRRCLDRSGPNVLLEKLPKKSLKKADNELTNKESKNEPKPNAAIKKTEVVVKETRSPTFVSKKYEKSSCENFKTEKDVEKPSKISKGSDRVLRNDNASNSLNIPDSKTDKIREVKKLVVELSKKELCETIQRPSIKVEDIKNKKDLEKNKLFHDTNDMEKTRLMLIAEEKRQLEKKIPTKKSSLIHKLSDDTEHKSSQRPSRKTKEAAAIYMEILSHKLVNNKKTDDDNISIDSFPELPNVKRTEQRENELKANANKSKSGRTSKHSKTVVGEAEITSAESEKIPENIKRVNEKNETDSDSDLKKKKTKAQPLRKILKEVECSQTEVDFGKSAIILKADKDKNSAQIEKINDNFFEYKIQNQEVQKCNLEGNSLKIKTEIKTETSISEGKGLSKPLNIPFEMIQKESTKDIKRETREHIDSQKIVLVDTKTEESVKDSINIQETITPEQLSVETNEIEMKESVPKNKSECDKDNGNAEKNNSAIELERISLQKEKSLSKKSNQKSIPLKDSSDSDEILAKLPNIQCIKDCKKQKTQGSENAIPEKIEKLTDISIKMNKPVSMNNPNILSDSDDECLANIGKAKEVKSKEDPLSKRQTRHSHKTKEAESEDSFHIEVKIPRKKQLTRIRSSKVSATSSRAKSSTRFNISSVNDESDESTTSSKNNTKIEENRIKKCPQKKGEFKLHAKFSDSDEEPLSKLTIMKKEEEKSAKELKEDILRKQKALIESPPTKTKFKKISNKDKEVKEKNITEIKDNADKNISSSLGKPKRECAKRPSNYLPMFSSSDDEEKFFHGFSLENEKKNESIYSHSSLDFLSKDLGRRFGKEKVNMSNEQIEKWLKDSVMAGDDSKKEEELKFCQEISTETSLNNNAMIDTEQLKTSLLQTQEVSTSKNETTPEKKTLSSQGDISKSAVYKSPGDRKPIFKKQKAKIAPTVGAFSVNNERSIYAFEEEVEDVLSTPFRRPSRRPSSTATSKSEDEVTKTEEQIKFGQFRKPSIKSESVRNEEQRPISKEIESTTKPSSASSSQKPPQKSSTIRKILGKTWKKQNSDHLDDGKYKVPSSPSASSSSSAKLYKKQNKHKVKPVEICQPVKMSDFPCNGPGELVEAPTFYPTEKEFQDPLEYIEKIGVKAEQFGICRIVPPSTFKPECKVSDDMRFTSYNQYIHKMLYRWGPNFKELIAIKKYLQTQNINLTQSPWIGGMEVDLPRLYQTVQSLGGLKEVIEKEKWNKVSDIMRIPKCAQDRVTKLDDIYCKYLLPYDTLSPDEREKLLDEVETEWAKRESKTLLKIQKFENLETENDSESESDDEVEECIIKGRNMALNAFYRIARNTMSMWFRNSEPSAQDIEQEFWKHVALRQNHICVHSGSIDSGSWGYGFAVSKNSPFARHAWNLKVLTNNSGSVLRSLGPVIGVTVPTLHVGMVFSACCWYRDPHSLPWIEYLHTGGNKIWYAIPNSVGNQFQQALTKLVPNYCRNQGIWLPSDTVMLPPSLLIESGVALSRIVQEPGQFIVVFPKAFTSSISTGYVVSESVFFAPPSWLKTAQMTFDLLKSSCEPSMFSLDKLYLSIINDQRTSVDVLKQMIPIVAMIPDREKPKRNLIRSLGVTNFEELPPPETPNARRKKKSQESGDYECEICRTNLFISMIVEQQEDAIYCLDHAIQQIEKKSIVPENCKLLYTYSENALDGLVAKINASIEQKLQKKVFNKFSGMPTLLNKQN